VSVPPSEFVADRSPIAGDASIRLATHDDLDTLVALDRRCFGKLWSRDTYARELDSPNSEILLLVAPPMPAAIEPAAIEPAAIEPTSIEPTAIEPIPTVLGYGCLWAIVDEAHVTILGVHPQWRRRGLGERLLCGLLAIARQRQLTRATLEVSTQNRAAIALYDKYGFRRAGCRKGYYPNGDDAAILWKSGLAHPQFDRELEAWRAALRDRRARLDADARSPDPAPPIH